MATTMHWAPNWRAPAPISSGSRTADEFRLTLSAPARNKAVIPSTERIPPPTVKGMNSCEAVRSTSSTRVSRP